MRFGAKSQSSFKWYSLLAAMAVAFICLPFASWAADDTQALKQQMEQMKKQMDEIQKKLDQAETQNTKQAEESQQIEERLSKAELHTATDKISFGVDLRSRADSIHYDDIRVAPAAFTNLFFAPYTGAPGGGFNGATLAQIQAGMAAYAAAGMIPPVEEVDADNDIIYTNRLRLEMKSKINSRLSFAGRIAAYKVFGDSTGVEWNHGSMSDVTFDGNTSSLPHGDTLRLERAYFNYLFDTEKVPINLSIGRRPSTEGPPLEYRNNSMEGGSPLATIINWQFDGASLNFGLEEVTGIPGAALKLCYGVGFEGDWGNSAALGSQTDVDDVHMYGLIADLYNNDVTSVVATYAHASGITDGFTGLTVMPYIVSVQNGQYFFEPNYGGYVSRIEPMTEIGDWDAASMLLRTNLAEQLADLDFFLAGSWSHTNPSEVSRIPFYQMMGMGLLSSNGELESQDGYSVYTGIVWNTPWRSRLGLEYNWGSQYWFNMTGAEDSLVASKLAARGQVWEAYWHQQVFKNNFFVTLGGQYYDYDYTGSGNPLGAPVKIDDITSLDAINPVVDKVWVAYLSATLRF